MTTRNETYYQQTDWNIVEDNWQRANERTGDPQEPGEETPADVLSLEAYAFELLNQLADDYGIYDNGSFTQAIWNANTPEAMQLIIDQLQVHLLMAMKDTAEVFSR